jgi:DNA-binding NtrC family response regulator
MAHRVLAVDDEETALTGLQALLTSWGYEADGAGDGKVALDRLVLFRPDLIVTDLVMPNLDGLELLAAVQREMPTVPVIILTGRGSIESAVTAMRQGAYDYLVKPVDVGRLRLLTEKALEKGDALREVSLLRRRLKDVWGTGRLVGSSRPMQEVLQLIELAAPTSASVLITGETGTGKELVARTLHELSPRARGPFIAVNCSAIPETLLESEILGHEKGAFTGALERRIGCFELAHEGTLFLDEIAEMSSSTQAKFLRILQEGSLRRLGSRSEIRVDVRVLAATNRDPLSALEDGSLREDLYYRLNVFSIALPPLRERRDDIPLLVQAFLEDFDAKYDKGVKAADEAALKLLAADPWPGNVRELRNTIERAVIACPGDVLSPDCLPPRPVAPARIRNESADTLVVQLGTSLREAERELILRTLALTTNNKTRAAQILGISQKTLHNKLHRYARSSGRPSSD